MMIQRFIFIWLLTLAQAYGIPLGLEVERSTDFGKIYHGELAKVSALFKNTSSVNLHIDRISTSCGCTSIDDHKKVIAAGNTLNLSFKINTLQKLGKIHKTARIYFKKDNKPLLLNFKGEVIAHPENHMHQSEESNIFSESCMSCHVLPAEGKRGQTLYLAACAMCHGAFKQGASAPPLLADLYRDDWKMVLEQGRNTMPGFSKHHGGPLDEQQIQSLLDELKGIENPNRAYQSKSPTLVFYRWCAPCHGSYKMGPIGPDIRTENLQHFNHDSLSQFLKTGSSNVMPSFHENQGGPLDDEALQKMVNYLLGPPKK